MNSKWFREIQKSNPEIVISEMLIAREDEFLKLPVEKNDPKLTVPIVAEFSSRLSTTVAELAKNGKIPVVIGGDHSIAIGTWSGIAVGHNLCEDLGLIWIDAHLDAHSPQTSISQAIHGMPIAVLLGRGYEELTSIGGPQAKISAKNLVLIGARSFEKEEAQFLKGLGVRVVTMEEVKKRGFESVFDEAIEVASENAKGIGISIDLDAFNPEHFPDVSTPVPGGLCPYEAFPVLKKIARHPKLLGIEIAEYSPRENYSEIDSSSIVLEALIRSLLVSENELVSVECSEG
jgi:arginase